jgi:hypothetical protein
MAGALGLPNRGAKYRSDLFVLNQCAAPTILLECCFVDSSSDAAAWNEFFEEFCQQTAAAIAGQAMQPPDENRPPVERPPAQEEKVVDVQIYAPRGVRVDVTINTPTEG